MCSDSSSTLAASGLHLLPASRLFPQTLSLQTSSLILKCGWRNRPLLNSRQPSKDHWCHLIPPPLPGGHVTVHLDYKALQDDAALCSLTFIPSNFGRAGPAPWQHRHIISASCWLSVRRWRAVSLIQSGYINTWTSALHEQKQQKETIKPHTHKNRSLPSAGLHHRCSSGFYWSVRWQTGFSESRLKLRYIQRILNPNFIVSSFLFEWRKNSFFTFLNIIKLPEQRQQQLCLVFWKSFYIFHVFQLNK